MHMPGGLPILFPFSLAILMPSLVLSLRPLISISAKIPASMKNNSPIIVDVLIPSLMELPDIMTELAILRGKSRTKTNPKGWIINALKGKIKDK